MKRIIQTTNSILQSNPPISLAIEESSDTIQYSSFGILPTKSSLWIPASGKSIYLTSVQVSAPLAVSFLLSDGNDTFLSLRVTESLGNASHRFYSAYELKPNHALMVNTADEQIKCTTSGAVSATQVAYNSRTDFTNVNNAIGLVNGSFSTLNSALLTQNAGRIVLGYTLRPSLYDSLEIQQVVIKYYCSLTLTLAVGTSSMILYWRPNPQAAWVELQQISLSLIGGINYLTTPVAHDITSAILAAGSPWDVLNTLQTSFVGVHTGLGLGNTIQLDAVEIEVCVNGKNQITVFGYEA